MWKIEPIPVDDYVGKEVITRLTANMVTNSTFYTDSNGRDFIKRVCTNPIYLYFYDSLQVINFNSLNMQVCHIISYHIFFLHWKIFLKIQGACMPRHLSHWKIILKTKENYLISRQLSPLNYNSFMSNFLTCT
jgi:hypothetical protein